MVLRTYLLRTLFACFAFASVALAGAFNRQPAGLIKGARLSWVSGTTIKVGVGYGENAGEYWEIAPTDSYNSTGFALTGLTATTNGVFHYIYIDKANSLFPAVTLVNSTTAPVWSDSYMGWYNGQNRCVGAVWVKADGAVASFVSSGEDTYNVLVGSILTNGGISTDYNVTNQLDTATWVPVNAYEVAYGVLAVWNGLGTKWENVKAGVGPLGGNLYFDSGFYGAHATCWVGLPRTSKVIIWYASASSTSGTATVSVRGYRIER